MKFLIFHYFLLRKLSNNREQPIFPNHLLNKENASDTQHEEKPDDDRKEGKEERVIR